MATLDEELQALTGFASTGEWADDIYSRKLQEQLPQQAQTPAYVAPIETDLSAATAPSSPTPSAQSAPPQGGGRILSNIPGIGADYPGREIVPIESFAPQQQQQQQQNPNALVNTSMGAKPGDNIDEGFASIKDYATKISEAKTFEDRFRLIQDMRQSSIGAIESAQARVKAEVDKNLGLDRLRKDAEYLNLQARHNPDFAQQANAMTSRVMQAEARSQSLVVQAMKQNPRLQALVKTVDSEIAVQTKLAENLYAEQRKKLEKDETRQEAAGDILQGIQPGAIDTLVGILPNLKKADGTIDSVATAKVIQSNKDWRPLLNGTIPPTKFMSEALQGSDAARVMTIAEESKRTGKTPQEVERQLQDAQTLLNNPNLLEQELIKYKISKPLTEAEASAKSKELLASGGKKKSQEEALREYQGNIGKVEKLFAAKNEERLQDLRSWPLETSPLNDPKANQIYEEFAKVKGKTPNVVEFTKAYVNAPGISKEEAAARQDIILNGYEQAAKKSQSSILHVPMSSGDISNNKRIIKDSLVRDVINAKMSTAERLGVAANESFSLNNPLNPLGWPKQFAAGANPILQATPGAVSDFFLGLVGSNK